MANIDSLDTSITEMSNDELLERIRVLRGARRITKPFAGRKTKAKKAKKPAMTATEIVATMSPDDMDKLIAELEGNL